MPERHTKLLEPAAKLATARLLDPATASHSLGEMLGLGRVTAKEVYDGISFHTANPEQDACPRCLLTPKQRDINQICRHQFSGELDYRVHVAELNLLLAGVSSGGSQGALDAAAGGS